MNKKWRGTTSAQVAALRRKLSISHRGAEGREGAANLRRRSALGMDSYEGAIAAARAGNVDRLVDCLRARKPMSDDDRDRLAGYIATRLRRRLWSPELVRALGPPTEDDYDLLADLVERTGRRRGGMSDEPAHRAARLAQHCCRCCRLGFRQDCAKRWSITRARSRAIRAAPRSIPTACATSSIIRRRAGASARRRNLPHIRVGD